MKFEFVAKIYDEVIGDMEYEAWSNDIKFLIDKYAKENPVLHDCSCGTGGHLEFLEKDFQCTGSDLSPEMIEIAKTKVKSKVSVKDMREITGNYDVVICLYDSLNNLTSLKDVKKAFQASYNSLNDKGIYIFDILTLKSMREMNNYSIQAGNIDEFSYIWENKFIEDVWEWKFTVFAPKGALYEKHVEHHKEYFYCVSDVKKMLTEVGFEVLDVHDTYSMDEIDGGTDRINIVARKC